MCPFLCGVPDNPSSVSNKRFAPTLPQDYTRDVPLLAACLFTSTDLRIFATLDPSMRLLSDTLHCPLSCSACVNPPGRCCCRWRIILSGWHNLNLAINKCTAADRDRSYSHKSPSRKSWSWVFCYFDASNWDWFECEGNSFKYFIFNRKSNAKTSHEQTNIADMWVAITEHPPLFKFVKCHKR